MGHKAYFQSGFERQESTRTQIQSEVKTTRPRVLRERAESKRDLYDAIEEVIGQSSTVRRTMDGGNGETYLLHGVQGRYAIRLSSLLLPLLSFTPLLVCGLFSTLVLPRSCMVRKSQGFFHLSKAGEQLCA